MSTLTPISPHDYPEKIYTPYIPVSSVRSVKSWSYLDRFMTYAMNPSFFQDETLEHTPEAVQHQ